MNNFARATGQSLREKIDLAMPDNILSMRFNQNPDDFIDNELFLRTNYRAGIQVEKFKALKQAKEAMRNMGSSEKTQPRTNGKTDGQNKASSDNTRKGRKTERDSNPRSGSGNHADKPAWGKFGKPGYSSTKADAVKAVPEGEQENYRKNPDNSWRCAMNGHRTYECFAHHTTKGTPLPKPPWKTAGVTGEKRKRNESEEPTPPPK